MEGDAIGVYKYSPHEKIGDKNYIFEILDQKKKGFKIQ